ncbi:MAG TPA: proton-conducting transporter membrane subunit [Stellaceae bacterium]|nr:proton-conducting transporter membrane subunit [Stellaceae bacterium]
MAGALIVALLGAPVVAILGCIVLRPAQVALLNLAASIVVFAVAVPLTVLSSGAPRYYWQHAIVLDAPGAWVVLCAAIVYLLSSIHAVGYMRLVGENSRLPSFYALFAGFALTILLSPLMNNAAVYWIAIELTTLVSTFLVVFERAAESIEASWKYIVLVSTGISLALLGTVLFYWNGSFVLGPTYAMTWDALRRAAPSMNPALTVLAFLLVLIGYGTKVGLAPMHTWLPDAHSESPTPVSAMLSGALLNAAMLGIVRYLAIADRAPAGILPRLALVVLGAFSLLIAALFIIRQQHIKRLMAYSSVEHMGVIALGFGFGGTLGVAGALYHMLNHSLNKSLMFFGAGNMMRSFGSPEIGRIREIGRQFPVQSGLWLLGAVAITGAPPFALFLSELVILRAGFRHAFAWAAALMAALLIVIFIGFLDHFRRMYRAAPPGEAAAAPLRAPGWCVVPMWLALVPLVILGLWWPQPLWEFFARVAQLLGVVGR